MKEFEEECDDDGNEFALALLLIICLGVFCVCCCLCGVICWLVKRDMARKKELDKAQEEIRNI